MKRWITGLLLVLLACVPVLLSRSSDPYLLKDSDTAFLLNAVRERHDPLSWFTGDWPLGNHFYRPISTLSFELDSFAFGDNAAGYGLTNALLAIACIVCLFWFLRELTDKLAVATSSALLFALWHTEWWWFVSDALLYLSVALAIGGLWRHGFRIRAWIPATLVLYFVHLETVPYAWIQKGVIQWLPGRTATVMSLFVLISLAAYARYERLSADRERKTLTPLDPPATRGTVATQDARGPVWMWAILSVFALLCALGSYEQAVMGPALLLGAAVAMGTMHIRVRWAWHFVFWAALVGYLLLRHNLVPDDTSAYQKQALRSGPGVLLDIAAYALPALAILPSFINSIVGWAVILFSRFWLSVFVICSNAAAIWSVKRHWQLTSAGYGLSLLAFLPMAWLNRFEHYHYLPMAFRSLFVVAMGWVAWDLTVIALSPRARQAPQRLSPAPGSLPRQ
ncbi:MAG: hypothetical protein ACAH95_15845 [Fimbriimonas sp.]